MRGAPVVRAGAEERIGVGEVSVERVALDARALGDCAERGHRGARGAVQLDRGLDDPPPSVGLPLGSDLHPVPALFHCTRLYLET
jgi:hypothetical protein